MWYVDYGAEAIGRITSSGLIGELPIPAPLNHPSNLLMAPDGTLWFDSITVYDDLYHNPHNYSGHVTFGKH
jgi:streptogramin lyase